MTTLGVTGSQLGGTSAQLTTLRQFLLPRATELHHGDCIGVDAKAHEMMQEIRFDWTRGGSQRIIIHPPSDPKKRAFCKRADFTWPELPYLKRDAKLADDSELVVALPETDEEQLRSGTWATVRYAYRSGKLVLVILRDGSIKPYPFLCPPLKGEENGRPDQSAENFPEIRKSV